MKKHNRALFFGLSVMFVAAMLVSISSCTMGAPQPDLGATQIAIANEFAALLAVAETPTIELTPTPTLDSTLLSPTVDPNTTLTPTETETPTPTVTSLPTGTLTRPASYTLQKGEFP